MNAAQRRKRIRRLVAHGGMHGLTGRPGHVTRSLAEPATRLVLHYADGRTHAVRWNAVLPLS